MLPHPFTFIQQIKQVSYKQYKVESCFLIYSNTITFNWISLMYLYWILLMKNTIAFIQLGFLFIFTFYFWKQNLLSYNISWIQFPLQLLLSVLPHFTSPPDTFTSCLSLEKNSLLRNNNLTCQHKIWQNKNYCIKTGQDKTKEGKETHQQTQQSETHLFT